jgi:hypothetical protein
MLRRLSLLLPVRRRNLAIRVTFDTNVLPITDIPAELSRFDLELAVVTVTDRELKNTRRADGLREIAVMIPETLILSEAPLGQTVLGSKESAERLPAILQILSNGAWPFPEPLSRRQRNLLRDALILEAHIREARDVLVSNDERAFIRYGRRAQLQSTFGTRILSRSEFVDALSGTPEEAVRCLTSGRS